MKKYFVELTYRTKVDAMNEESAYNKARKELKRYTIKADITYCEEI